MLLLAWRAGHQAEDADLGDKAAAVSHFIETKFATDIAHISVALGACALGIGLLLGLAAYGLMRARGAHRASAPRFAAESLAVVIGLHALVTLHALARTPQLYATRFYSRGGALRTLQVLATDVLGPHGALALAVGVVALYVLGPGGRRGVLRPAHALAKRTWARARGLVPGAAALSLVALGWQPSAPSSVASIAPSPGPTPAPAPAPAPSTAGGRLNVLVLAADSLRADRIAPATTPNLLALSARSTRFERAYVSVPRTFSSWVTILTGRHAHHHGVRSMFPRWEDRAKDLDALPQRLAREGYATEVVGDYAADIFGRVDLGFARVDTPSFDFRQMLRQRGLERETPLLPFLHSHTGRALFPVLKELSHAADAELLADDAIAALARHARAPGGEPFFLTAFFSTAHFPYAAPAPYYTRFTDPAYRGRYKYHKPVGLGGEQPPDDADIAQIRALYDGAVLSIDEAMGRVLRALTALGLADTTIVVVTADHGETLYDHGHGQGHGDHLFGDEGTHVPLIVHDPRAPIGRRVSDVVRDVDIAPTLYDLTSVAPSPHVDGRSLAPALSGRALSPAYAFAETELWFTEDILALPPRQRLPYPGIMQMTELDSTHGQVEVVLQKAMAPITLVARHRMVRDARWKLLYIPTRMGVEYMLFDTEHDPGEVSDVAKAQPAEVERLRAPLWKWMLEDRGMIERDGMLVPREEAR